MSTFGGCIVCGVTLGEKDNLRCSDCVAYKFMEQTGAKARYIRLDNEGPVDVTYEVYEMLDHECWNGDNFIARPYYGKLT